MSRGGGAVPVFDTEANIEPHRVHLSGFPSLASLVGPVLEKMTLSVSLV